MTCPKRSRRSASSNREAIATLFVKGKAEAAFFHRYSICMRASPCGRACARLVKPPGLRAFCVDLQANARVDLYEALKDPDFRCPEGLF